MAESDHLTKLQTRASFDAALVDLARGANDASPASIIFADIDRFKLVNDTHGHPAGDRVLTEVARRLMQVVSGRGAAYRYGGEEFAVLLPNHTVDEAIAIAERARRVTEATPVDGISVTSSYGIATCPLHAVTPTDWLKKADEALYDAKLRGRNLVRVTGEPAPTADAPRTPNRKQAKAGEMSSEDKERLRVFILSGHRAPCPVDGIPLDALDNTHLGETGRSFLVNCPGCGFSTVLPGPGHKN